MSPSLRPSAITGTDWRSEEVALVVADYFAMFAADLAGRSYNKKEHNRGLQSLTGRSAGSIEFKHQNISAVLAELGLPWLRGYKPRFNYQDALVDEVGRYLARAPHVADAPVHRPEVAPDIETLFVPPPPLAEGRPNEAMARLIRKFDPAERDERNRALGKAGEQFVFEVEERRLMAAGRKDLMRRIRWVSRDEGDGAGYDIASFDPRTGAEKLIEVKTTRGATTTPFFLTRNEEALSRERPDAFYLYRVFDFGEHGRIFTLRPPLDRAVNLEPTVWSASFR